MGIWFSLHFFKKSDKIDTAEARTIPRGHTVFKYNIRTKSLVMANVYIGENKRKTCELVEGCLFVSGLNRTSAIKKINKMGFHVLQSAQPVGRTQPAGNYVFFIQPTK